MAITRLSENLLTSNQNLREAIYKAFDGKCFYTGQYVPKENMHVDHLIPKSKGGENIIENYVLTSKGLNLAKSNFIDYGLIKRMQYILKIVYVPKIKELLYKPKPKEPKKIYLSGNNKKASELEKSYKRPPLPCLYCGIIPKGEKIVENEFWYCFKDGFSIKTDTAKIAAMDDSNFYSWLDNMQQKHGYCSSPGIDWWQIECEHLECTKQPFTNLYLFDIFANSAWNLRKVQIKN